MSVIPLYRPERHQPTSAGSSPRQALRGAIPFMRRPNSIQYAPSHVPPIIHDWLQERWCGSKKGQRYPHEGPGVVFSSVSLFFGSIWAHQLNNNLFLRNVQQFRGRLVFKAHGLLYHSSLGSTEIKMNREAHQF